MTLTFDRANYSNLLAEVSPRAIETEEEYDRLLAVAQRLTFAKNRTPEEQALHKLLVTLIEVYEAQNYAIDKSEPHEILQHIMEASGTLDILPADKSGGFQFTQTMKAAWGTGRLTLHWKMPHLMWSYSVLHVRLESQAIRPRLLY